MTTALSTFCKCEFCLHECMTMTVINDHLLWAHFDLTLAQRAASWLHYPCCSTAPTPTNRWQLQCIYRFTNGAVTGSYWDYGATQYQRGGCHQGSCKMPLVHVWWIWVTCKCWFLFPKTCYTMSWKALYIVNCFIFYNMRWIDFCVTLCYLVVTKKQNVQWSGEQKALCATNDTYIFVWHFCMATWCT